LLWWKAVFKDDFYIELMRHGQEDEKIVNETLLKFSRKHHIKIVASNNTFYLEKDLLMKKLYFFQLYVFITMKS